MSIDKNAKAKTVLIIDHNKMRSRWIAYKPTGSKSMFRRFFVSIGAMKYKKNTTKAMYSIFTCHGLMHKSRSTKVVRKQRTSKQMFACLFGIASHLATVALEQP